MWPRRESFVFGLLCAAMAWLPPATAKAPPPPALDVKLAMLERILGFVTWPDHAGPGETVEVVVVAAPAVARRFSEIYANRSLMGRRVRVTAVSESWPATGQPDVVFLGARADKRLETILKALGGVPLLTCADTDGFGARGVAINFYYDDEGRTRFEINRSALRRAGIQASYHLSTLARLVGEP